MKNIAPASVRKLFAENLNNFDFELNGNEGN